MRGLQIFPPSLLFPLPSSAPHPAPPRPVRSASVPLLAYFRAGITEFVSGRAQSQRGSGLGLSRNETGRGDTGWRGWQPLDLVGTRARRPPVFASLTSLPAPCPSVLSFLIKAQMRILVLHGGSPGQGPGAPLPRTVPAPSRTRVCLSRLHILSAKKVKRRLAEQSACYPPVRLLQLHATGGERGQPRPAHKPRPATPATPLSVDVLSTPLATPAQFALLTNTHRQRPGPCSFFARVNVRW